MTNKTLAIPTDQLQACTELVHNLTVDDLPLCCPLPNQRLWDAHPRIYMPIEKSGREICPYCGTLYVLKNHDSHHDE